MRRCQGWRPGAESPDIQECLRKSSAERDEHEALADICLADILRRWPKSGGQLGRSS